MLTKPRNKKERAAYIAAELKKISEQEILSPAFEKFLKKEVELLLKKK